MLGDEQNIAALPCKEIGDPFRPRPIRDRAGDHGVEMQPRPFKRPRREGNKVFLIGGYRMPRPPRIPDPRRGRGRLQRNRHIDDPEARLLEAVNGPDVARWDPGKKEPGSRRGLLERGR